LDSTVDFVALLWQSVLLGLAAAFTPSLLALQLLIVSGDPWRRRALAVAVGGAAAFGIVGALLFLGFAQLPTEGLGSHPAEDAVLRLVAGVVLVTAAAWLFRPHAALQARVEGDIRGYVARASTWVFLGVAFALSIKDLSSFVVLAPALHDIAVAPINVAEQAVLLAVLYGLALSPVLVPPLLRVVLGHRANGFFTRTYRFTMSHQFELVGGMAGVIGCYLIVTGLLRLP
jgi:hypothetical protein